MEEDIRAAKARADVVIMSIHWGIHHVPGMLADYQFTVGHRAIDAGADLILGTHAHLIKGIEIYKGKAIFFSLGNFAEETPHHLAPPPGAFHSSTSPKYGFGNTCPESGTMCREIADIPDDERRDPEQSDRTGFVFSRVGQSKCRAAFFESC